MRRETALCLVLSACGSSPPPSGQPADAGAPDAAAEAAVMTLVEASWTLPPYTETYLCARKTITEEAWIARFEPIAPLGTHHTVLTLDVVRAPDGVEECGATTVAPRMIFGSGVGTGSLEMPEGVAMRVSPGQQLVLNLHLFNTSDAPLSGTSGVRVRTVAPGEVRHEAEAILGGTLDLEIEPGVSSQYGRCTVPAGTTIFAAGPHMHKLGIRQKLSVASTGQVLYDRDYSFDEQTFETMSISFAAPERLDIECVYANDTGGIVGWGESTNAEMCFAILFRYPATARFFPVCVN
jgi:hypothetical protein